MNENFYSEIKELLEDHVIGHSFFQDDYFIVYKSGGTPYGQYKQALRELHKRYKGLREEFYIYEKNEIEIKMLEKSTDELDVLELKYKKLRQEDYYSNLVSTYREFYRFYQIAKELKTYLVDKYGELTDGVVDMLDTEMWIWKLKEFIAKDIKTNGRITSATYESMLGFPKDIRNIFLTDYKLEGFNERLPSGKHKWDEGLNSILEEVEKSSNEIIDYSAIEKKSFKIKDVDSILKDRETFLRLA